jgi:hypothetical protein
LSGASVILLFESREVKEEAEQVSSSRPRKGAGELGEDRQVGVKLDPLKPTDPERQ